jgi:hypothetical protein
MLELSFQAAIIYWRGPAPFFYAPLPPDDAEEVRQIAKFVTYGWGVIPVEATVNDVTFTTSLFPKDGTYLLPLKDDVRKRCGITADDVISVEMIVGPDKR